MSYKIDCLHSHSGLERELRLPKDIVLVDAQYKHLFLSDTTKDFTYNKVKYVKVPILSFIQKGGIFKNLIT